MSDQIFHNDFSAGWVPSDNYISGRKNGLLQMDNLCLDDNGALTSAKGPAAISAPLAGKAHTLFSATISGIQKQFAALTNGTIMEGDTFTDILGSGGSISRAAFANVLDQILICSGNVYLKWDGTTVRTLGISPPGGAPNISANASVVLSVADLDGSNEFTNWVIDDGTLISDTAFAFAVNPAALNNLGQIHVTYGAIKNTGAFPNGSPADPLDVFQIPMTFSDGSNVGGIQVSFFPDDGAGGFDFANAFIFTFDNTNTSFPIGSGTVVLKCQRDQFDNGGSFSPPFTLWQSIRGIRIYFWGNTLIDYTFGDMTFTGSSTAVLTGNYEYLQVDVYNTGKYLAQSNVSALATVSVATASVNVAPWTIGTDPQVNEIWIYRRNTATEQNYYRIAVLTDPYTSFDDSLSDTVAELLDITANLFLTPVISLTINIQDIIGLWFDRVLYFDDKNIYFSDRLNADSIDSRKTVTYSGNTSEKFLWARKVTNSVIIVATDLDNYELTGTFNELPDGTLDISFRPLAVKNPAVSIAATVYSSSVIYQAADGWRLFDGINSTALTQDFDVLYKNTAKYGYLPISDGYFAGQLYSAAAIANNKLYITQADINGDYRCYIYDFARKYWYTYIKGAYALAVREDGTIFGSSFIDDIIYNFDLTAGTPTVSQALFVVESNNTPRNRKDTYTFKCRVDTGSSDLKVYIYKDQIEFGGAGVLIGTINTPTLTEVIINLSNSIGICKSYQIQLQGTFSRLIFSDYSIDFDTRPTQLTHLRKQPDNFGSAAIKQLSVLPFVIDTLGNDVKFTPNIDGVDFPAQVFNTPDKKTCYYYFDHDLLMIDAGGKLDGVLFEFYGWLTPELTEVLQVTRIFDNTGPIEFTRNARFLAVRFRLFPLGSSIKFRVKADEVTVYEIDLAVQPLKELTYEVIMPRRINGTVFQLEHLSNDGKAFAKMSIEYKAVVTGGQTDNGWRKVKSA